jgi:hypothetical protein
MEGIPVHNGQGVESNGQASRRPGGCPSGAAFSAKQSRRMSLVEAVTNVVVGFAVALLTQIIVFPLFDLEVTLGENLAIGALFTGASLCRAYVLRRLFEAIRVRARNDNDPGTLISAAKTPTGRPC